MDTYPTMTRTAVAPAEEQGQDEHTAPTALYYGAIAAALTGHRHKITALSYENLANSFGALAEGLLIPHQLRDLFRRAQELCRQRTP